MNETARPEGALSAGPAAARAGCSFDPLAVASDGRQYNHGPSRFDVKPGETSMPQRGFLAGDGPTCQPQRASVDSLICVGWFRDRVALAGELIFDGVGVDSLPIKRRRRDGTDHVSHETRGVEPITIDPARLKAKPLMARDHWERGEFESGSSWNPRENGVRCMFRRS